MAVPMTTTRTLTLITLPVLAVALQDVSKLIMMLMLMFWQYVLQFHKRCMHDVYTRLAMIQSRYGDLQISKVTDGRAHVAEYDMSSSAAR